MDFQRLQSEVDTWALKNFGLYRGLIRHNNVEGFPQLMGVMEEVGELAHAHLKEYQGIRGSTIEHQNKARDAIGDIIIYLADYCSIRGFNLQTIVENTWDLVKRRDWVNNKETGG